MPQQRDSSIPNLFKKVTRKEPMSWLSLLFHSNLLIVDEGKFTFLESLPGDMYMMTCWPLKRNLTISMFPLFKEFPTLYNTKFALCDTSTSACITWRSLCVSWWCHELSDLLGKYWLSLLVLSSTILHTNLYFFDLVNFRNVAELTIKSMKTLSDTQAQSQHSGIFN